jgi:F0F1-type ATP synthase membrane subunit b/b'
MEKVWEELKKIEDQAQQIRLEAEEKAKEIINLAEKEAETLVNDSQTYSKEESEKIVNNAISEATKTRESELKEYSAFLERLKKKAEKRLPKVEKIIIDTTLGKREP